MDQKCNANLLDEDVGMMFTEQPVSDEVIGRTRKANYSGRDCRICCCCSWFPCWAAACGLYIICSCF